MVCLHKKRSNTDIKSELLDYHSVEYNCWEALEAKSLFCTRPISDNYVEFEQFSSECTKSPVVIFTDRQEQCTHACVNKCFMNSLQTPYKWVQLSHFHKIIIAHCVYTEQTASHPWIQEDFLVTSSSYYRFDSTLCCTEEFILKWLFFQVMLGCRPKSHQESLWFENIKVYSGIIRSIFRNILALVIILTAPLQTNHASTLSFQRASFV